MIRVVTVHSKHLQTDLAAKAVLDEAVSQLAGKIPIAALLFVSAHHDNAVVVERINDAFGDIELIGCTTDGEISHLHGYAEDSITLSLFCSDTIEIAAGLGRDISINPTVAVQQCVRMATRRLTQEARLCLAFPDGLSPYGGDVLANLNTAFEPSTAIVGGMAADSVSREKKDYRSYQFYKNEIVSDALPVLVFAGDIHTGIGLDSGWQPVGKAMQVSRASGSLVYELDGDPAIAAYRHYLGDITENNFTELSAYPLAVYEEGSDRFYLRVVDTNHYAGGELSFFGEVPQGATVRITQAIRSDIIDGANVSMNKARDAYSGQQPAAAFTFSCTGRKLALGSRINEEVEQLGSLLKETLPVSGFYTFGEIAPLLPQGRARIHNTTFVTLLLGS